MTRVTWDVSVGGNPVCEVIGFRACVMSVRMTRLAVSLGALTERIDVLKTAKMAKNATLLTFTGPSFGLFALCTV